MEERQMKLKLVGTSPLMMYNRLEGVPIIGWEGFGDDLKSAVKEFRNIKLAIELVWDMDKQEWVENCIHVLETRRG